MKNMTLEHIAAVCGGTYIGNEEDKTREIQGAVIDSRLVEKIIYLSRYVEKRWTDTVSSHLFLKKERWQCFQKRG